MIKALHWLRRAAPAAACAGLLAGCVVVPAGYYGGYYDGYYYGGGAYAGAGEVVLYASGSSARQTPTTKDRPVDAVIMAIVDSFDANGSYVRLA